MCGIAAIIDYAKIEPKVEDIKSMTDLLAHRGPDGEGFFIKGGVALGHRRLAIIDVDQRSNQPMHRSNLHLIFNGMIYNYLEIKEELIALGTKFTTSSDTEVIIEAYSQWGIDAFNRFNGMWAIILFDEKKNRVICSRDRFGIKPLYYTYIGNKLFFASEIKAFKGIKEWNPKINHTRLFEYLAYKMTDHTEETMFDGVYQLPKSHHAIINLHSEQIDIIKYYDIRHNKKVNNGEELLNLFEDAIRLRTRTDVPLASTLSGGMDSSSIVSVLAAKLDTVSNTYTLAYPGNIVDESNYALMVNKKYQIPSNLVTTTEDYLKQHLDRLVYHQDEPFMGATVMAQSHIYEKINSGGYKVILGGQGGDEILCGYDKFSVVNFKEQIKTNPLNAITELYAFQRLRYLGIINAIRRIIFYEKNKRKKTRDWYKLNKEQENKIFKIGKENKVFDMSYNLLFGMGISTLLRYEDRNSMSYGVESRLPFLDYRLVEYCLNLPSNLKLKKGITKIILRRNMKGIVPNKIITRNDKMGFVTPQNEWMNNDKESYLKLASASLDKMPFIDKEKVKTLITNDNGFLWRVINAGLWISKFNISV